ncbi:hypothetical protein P9112_001510 [Eukaryota sp. TZLM1-RC]
MFTFDYSCQKLKNCCLSNGSSTSPSKPKNEVTRTDPVPSPLENKRFVDGGNENGPGSLSSPNVEPVVKVTDENPTLKKSTP